MKGTPKRLAGQLRLKIRSAMRTGPSLPGNGLHVTQHRTTSHRCSALKHLYSKPSTPRRSPSQLPGREPRRNKGTAPNPSSLIFRARRNLKCNSGIAIGVDGRQLASLLQPMKLVVARVRDHLYHRCTPPHPTQIITIQASMED